MARAAGVPAEVVQLVADVAASAGGGRPASRSAIRVDVDRRQGVGLLSRSPDVGGGDEGELLWFGPHGFARRGVGCGPARPVRLGVSVGGQAVGKAGGRDRGCGRRQKFTASHGQAHVLVLKSMHRGGTRDPSTIHFFTDSCGRATLHRFSPEGSSSASSTERRMPALVKASGSMSIASCTRRASRRRPPGLGRRASESRDGWRS